MTCDWISPFALGMLTMGIGIPALIIGLLVVCDFCFEHFPLAFTKGRFHESGPPRL